MTTLYDVKIETHIRRTEWVEIVAESQSAAEALALKQIDDGNRGTWAYEQNLSIKVIETQNRDADWE